MNEILPGVFHWTAPHEAIGADVSSYYVRSAGVVVDPKLPVDGLEVLPGEPQQVVLSSGHHVRDAKRFAEEFEIPIRASHEAAARIGDALEIEPFGHNDEVAPDLRSIHIGKLSPDEGALHLSFGEGAVFFADGLNRCGGELAFFPDELLGNNPGRVKQGLKSAFRGLLTRDFDHLLFAHGDPLIGGGKTALREFVGSPVGRPAHGQAL